MRSVRLIISRFQSISGSFPCIWRMFVIITPTESSTPQSGQWIRLLVRSWYAPPLTVQRHPIASSSIQDLIVPGWYVLVLDFVTFNTILYRSKRPMSTFIMPKSHYSYCDTTTPLSAQKSPKRLPTTSPNTFCATSWSYTVSAKQFLATFTTI